MRGYAVLICCDENVSRNVMKNLPLVANKQGICSRNINIHAIWVWAENTVNSGVLLHLHHQTLQFFGEPPVPTVNWHTYGWCPYKKSLLGWRHPTLFHQIMLLMVENTAYKQTQFSMSVGAKFLPSILSQAHWPSPFSREYVSMIIIIHLLYIPIPSKDINIFSPRRPVLVGA